MPTREMQELRDRQERLLSLFSAADQIEVLSESADISPVAHRDIRTHLRAILATLEKEIGASAVTAKERR